MFNDLLHDEDFALMMQKHIADTLEFLLKKGYFFSILTNIEYVSFEPSLPSEISSSFRPITLFMISEYTFETCKITDEALYFEAGFGSENFGSYVRVPLYAIVQIILQETPILINLSVYEPKQDAKQSKIEKSTNIFLSEPENQNLLKDGKKPS